MVVFAALHMGWLKFLAVFLKERKRKKKIKIKTCVKKRYCINNLHSVKAVKQSVQWLTLLSCGQTLLHHCQQFGGRDIPAEECICAADINLNCV